MSREMDVSIVIRTKNEADSIGQTLEAITQQVFNGTYEIVVVDSGSTDDTLALADKYGVKPVPIRQDEFTYGRSLNIGIEQALGRFIVNLSAHAIPAGKTWLQNMIAGFRNPSVAGVYGKQISDGNMNPLEAFQNERLFGSEDVLYSGQDKRKLAHAHFSNGNGAIRKDVWERIRFDEDVPYAEDTLWQQAVIRSGYSIYYKADAPVHHTHKLDPYRSYRNSKLCARTMAAVNCRKKGISAILADVMLFCYLVPVSVLGHVSYAMKGNHLKYLPILPFAVFCVLAGWLAGRVSYQFGAGTPPAVRA